jgi:protein ImuA
MIARRDLGDLKRRIATMTSARPDAPMGEAGGGETLLAFGVPPIDGVLRGAGVPAGALHEVAGAGRDEEQGAAAAALLALGLKASAPHGWVLWVTQDADLYAPGLAAFGLDLRRLVLVVARRDVEVCWALEEALRSRALSAVVGEIGAVSLTETRRLQLAAELAGIPCFLLRRWRNGALAARHRGQPIAAATRWRIAARGTEAPQTSALELGPLSWRLDLWRCRNGKPASWVVEVSHDEYERITALPVAVADPLGDRPAPTAPAPHESVSASIAHIGGPPSTGGPPGIGSAGRQPAGDPGRRSARG